jgi:UDP-glucose 4-epimerase
MKILFTGASSYIAYWIIKELDEKGHEVTAILRKSPKDYEGIKRERVDLVSKHCKIVNNVSIGDDKFLELVRSEKWDALCMHAAVATDPRSPEFDWLSALSGNTKNVEKIFEEFKKAGGNSIIVTGSLYEAGGVAGTEPLEAFNRYGLSKTLTWETFRYFAKEFDVNLGKIVFPIVFGMYEDPKFVSYLVRTWYAGETPTVRTPKYVRDNIEVTLLAKAYRDYLEKFVKTGSPKKFYPSQYSGPQGDFARRVAREMAPRLGIDCPVEFNDQTEFPETKIKINTDMLDYKELGWDEKRAWDDLAKYFEKLYAKQK